jgi:hypothetical protein
MSIFEERRIYKCDCCGKLLDANEVAPAKFKAMEAELDDFKYTPTACMSKVTNKCYVSIKGYISARDVVTGDAYLGNQSYCYDCTKTMLLKALAILEESR